LALVLFAAFYYAPAATHNCVLHNQDDAHGNSFGIHEMVEYPDSAYYVPDAINSFLHYSSALFLQICFDGHFDISYWSNSVAFLTGEYVENLSHSADR